MKQIHVNAYTKSDGTQVKEHWRGGESKGTVADPGDDIITKILEKILPNGGRMEDGIDTKPSKLDTSISNGFESPSIVLEGGVEIDVDLGGIDWGNIGEAIVGVAICAAYVAIKAAPFVLKAMQAVQKADTVALSKIKPQINNSIQSLHQIQNQAKANLDNTLKSLANAKGQEYSQIYKSYTNQKKSYEKADRLIQLMEYATENNDYQMVINELKNYQSNFEQVVAQNMVENPLSIQQQPVNMNQAPVHSPYMNPNIQSNVATPILQKGVIDVGMGGYNAIRRNNLNDAKELWKMASHDFSQSASYTAQNGQVIQSVFQLPSPELRQIVQTKLQQQLGVDDAMGVIFSPDSNLSKAIANSAEFKTHIQENIPELAKGEIIRDSSTYFESDKNLKLALGHADILYTTITPEGDLYALVLDTYDFNADDPDWKVRVARAVQDAGMIRNYYTLFVLFVPNRILEQLLEICF
ncbi:MAG: hypothetical protein LBK53_02500 [Heliobacteriaceae bacterium]|jgi:hypothetical protein|nr:hypothetical protein [Heliobacteriaceae bacterium]